MTVVCLSFRAGVPLVSPKFRVKTIPYANNTIGRAYGVFLGYIDFRCGCRVHNVIVVRRFVVVVSGGTTVYTTLQYLQAAANTRAIPPRR